MGYAEANRPYISLKYWAFTKNCYNTNAKNCVNPWCVCFFILISIFSEVEVESAVLYSGSRTTLRGVAELHVASGMPQ